MFQSVADGGCGPVECDSVGGGLRDVQVGTATAATHAQGVAAAGIRINLVDYNHKACTLGHIERIAFGPADHGAASVSQIVLADVRRIVAVEICLTEKAAVRIERDGDAGIGFAVLERIGVVVPRSAGTEDAGANFPAAAGAGNAIAVQSPVLREAADAEDAADDGVFRARFARAASIVAARGRNEEGPALQSPCVTGQNIADAKEPSPVHGSAKLFIQRAQRLLRPKCPDERWRPSGDRS